MLLFYFIKSSNNLAFSNLFSICFHLFLDFLLLIVKEIFSAEPLFKTDATRTQRDAVPNMVVELWRLPAIDWLICDVTDNANPARSLSTLRVLCISVSKCRDEVEKQRRERKQCPVRPKPACNFQ